jgi:hypothetical protein
MDQVVQQGGTIPVWAALGTLITFLGTIVGLVVWLVKRSQSRQDEMTKEFISFMKLQVETQAKTHSDQMNAQVQIHGKHADATEKLATVVNENTNQLKELTRIVGQCNPDRRIPTT